MISQPSLLLGVGGDTRQRELIDERLQLHNTAFMQAFSYEPIQSVQKLTKIKKKRYNEDMKKMYEVFSKIDGNLLFDTDDLAIINEYCDNFGIDRATIDYKEIDDED